MDLREDFYMSNYISKRQFLEQDRKTMERLYQMWCYVGDNDSLVSISYYNKQFLGVLEILEEKIITIKDISSSVHDIVTITPLLNETQLRIILEIYFHKRISVIPIEIDHDYFYDITTYSFDGKSINKSIKTKDVLNAYWQLVIEFTKEDLYGRKNNSRKI
jgi:hypothetical protein